MKENLDAKIISSDLYFYTAVFLTQISIEKICFLLPICMQQQTLNGNFSPMTTQC